jgi:hypothetical protein
MIDINIFLADIIKFAHIFVIVFVVLSPFQNDKKMSKKCIILLLFILHGWFWSKIDPNVDKNSESRLGKCGLTIIESKLRGTPYQDGFIFQLIKPFKKIEENNLDVIIVVLTFFLLIVNIAIYNSK